MSDTFTPVLYTKTDCPFCFKARLFLLESGVANQVELRNYVPGGAEEQEVRAKVAPHVEKFSVPVLETAPGEFLPDSDAIIDHLTRKHGATRDLPLLAAYRQHILGKLLEVYKELQQLKAK
ncbi:glutathione S-transferase N-terminal domain-containing protein [Lichenicoccus sp.]|uniref:glutathione S-transferase N-terminal domain-containing protein n=1 Tax=Lichenicoccus sp. TaxID=2781899 RepID=UPI003D0C89FA